MIPKRCVRTVGFICLLFLPIGHAAQNSEQYSGFGSQGYAKQLTNAAARIRALEGVKARVRRGMSPSEAIDRALEAALVERRELERGLAERDALGEDQQSQGSSRVSTSKQSTQSRSIPDLRVEWSGAGQEGGAAMPAAEGSRSHDADNGAGEVLSFRAQDHEAVTREKRTHGSQFSKVSTAESSQQPGTRAESGEYAVVFHASSAERASRIADLMSAYDYNDVTYLEGSRVTLLEAVDSLGAAQDLAAAVHRRTGHEPIVRSASSVQRLIASGEEGEEVQATRRDAGSNAAEAAPAAQRKQNTDAPTGRARTLSDGLDARYQSAAAGESHAGLDQGTDRSPGRSAERDVYDVLYRVEDAGSLDALRSLLHNSQIEDWFVARSGKAIYLGRFDSLQQALQRQRRLKLRIGRLPTIEEEEVREHHT